MIQKILFFVFSIIISISSQAQFFQIDTLKGHSPLPSSDNSSSDVNKYIFPKFISKKKPQAAKSINMDLIADVLQVKSGEEKESIFEAVWATKKNPMPSLFNISWAIISNTKKVLSLNISATGCGAYCEDFTRGFNYNSKNGNRLFIDSIFSRTGSKNLCDTLLKKERRIIMQFINNIKDTLKTKTVIQDQETKERYANMLSLYEYCLDFRNSLTAKDLNFTIEKQHVIIVFEQCAPHANRALDDIGDFRFDISLKEWKGQLTPFGVYLLEK